MHLEQFLLFLFFKFILTSVLLTHFKNKFRKCRKQRIKNVQIIEERKIDIYFFSEVSYIFFSPLTRIAGSRQAVRSGTDLEVL